jgi:hypothetical protein
MPSHFEIAAHLRETAIALEKKRNHYDAYHSPRMDGMGFASGMGIPEWIDWTEWY